MTTIATRTWRAAVIGRWAARILGTLMVLFLLAFVFGEGPPPLARMNAREQLYSLGMGALFLGLVMAWFWEGWGGLLSVVGWGFLAVVDNGPQWDLPFSIPAAVGLLHLLCWWRLRGPAPPVQPLSSVTRARLGVLFVFFWAALGVFPLLCANEIFGQPPLMTGSSRPSADVVGTWSADGIPVVFTIGPDGSVSGGVGNAVLTTGQIVSNRSWFGRLMNWRTDYLIRGTLSRVVESYGGAAGDHLSAPLNLRGPALNGTLFLSNPGAPKPLGLNLRKR